MAMEECDEVHQDPQKLTMDPEQQQQSDALK